MKGVRDGAEFLKLAHISQINQDRGLKALQFGGFMDADLTRSMSNRAAAIISATCWVTGMLSPAVAARP